MSWYLFGLVFVVVIVYVDFGNVVVNVSFGV